LHVRLCEGGERRAGQFSEQRRRAHDQPDARRQSEADAGAVRQHHLQGNAAFGRHPRREALESERAAPATCVSALRVSACAMPIERPSRVCLQKI